MLSYYRRVYLDYNATTPLEPEVLNCITTALQDAWRNPSSSHEPGKRAKHIIEEARSQVAEAVGADSADIIFTSGGTEANNMVLYSAIQYFYKTFKPRLDVGDGSSGLPNIISSKIEHPAVNEYLEHLSKTGQADITYVPVCHKTGRVESADILSAIKSTTIMVTVMLANNETGIIQNIENISRSIRTLPRKETETPRILLHTDAAQAIGKIPVDARKLDVDYLTIVGHKFYGPRIGALYVRSLATDGAPLYPLLFGGGQERGFRPGTENTGMIAGLGKACKLASINLTKHAENMKSCRDYLEERLINAYGGRVHFNGKIPGTQRLPNTCNVSFIGEGLQGAAVLSRCKVVQASTGAACHSQNRVSPILTAIGIDFDTALNAIRLSLGRYTEREEIELIVEDLVQAVKHCTENKI